MVNACLPAGPSYLNPMASIWSFEAMQHCRFQWYPCRHTRDHIKQTFIDSSGYLIFIVKSIGHSPACASLQVRGHSSDSEGTG
jgi:hypothetical protein